MTTGFQEYHFHGIMARYPCEEGDLKNNILYKSERTSITLHKFIHINDERDVNALRLVNIYDESFCLLLSLLININNNRYANNLLQK